MLVVYSFQLNLVRTMLSIESTYEQLAGSLVASAHASPGKMPNVLIVCDRGAMDASACMQHFRYGPRGTSLLGPFRKASGCLFLKFASGCLFLSGMPRVVAFPYCGDFIEALSHWLRASQRTLRKGSFVVR